MDKKVLVPIAQGTEEMEAIIVIDLLRRSGISVKVASEGEITTCSRGIKIIADTLLDKISTDERFDAIVLPGGAEGTENLLNNSHLEDLLKSQKEKEGLIAAICAAPTILATHNLLNPETVITSHPSVKNQLTQYKYLEEKVVFSGNFLTSRGAGTAIDFALALIEILVSVEKAKEISMAIMY